MRLSTENLYSGYTIIKMGRLMWEFKLQGETRCYIRKKTGESKVYTTLRVSLPKEVVEKYQLRVGDRIRITEEKKGKLAIFLPSSASKASENPDS
jgi:hypothetical protein